MSSTLPPLPAQAAVVTESPNPVVAWFRRFGPGLCLSALIAAGSMWLAGAGPFKSNGISALTIAIVLGILVGNTFYARIGAVCGPGVGFSKQYLLRLGIILYGFRLTFQDIGHVGVAGVTIDALIIVSTFLLAWVAGTRLFKMERESVMLIGAGSSICGAAAVMAAQSVVRGRAEQVAVAVSTVVVFGTLSMFLYPVLIHFNTQWQLLPAMSGAAGLYIGATVHEVAQVAAAAASLGSSVADTAVITKMVRVMMLAPFLVVLSLWLCGPVRTAECQEHGPGIGRRVLQAMPWFAVAFIAVAGLNSFHIVPADVRNGLDSLGTLALAMAMAALGMSTHISAVRTAGRKPILLASLLFAWLVIGGGAITLGVTALAG